MSEKAFRIGAIRPPSEANSLLIQVTNGCTWNRCKFCRLYRHTKFRAYPVDSIKEDIDKMALWAERVEAHFSGSWDIDGINRELAGLEDEEDRQCFYTVVNWLLSGGENVFLQDGNTMALSGGRLSDILIHLKRTFPRIKRITSYGRAENLSRISEEEFAELKEAGLDRIHSGYESGSDRVLKRINKGVTQEQQIIAGKAVKKGGIELSIYFMPGIGGKDLSEDNAVGTADVINKVKPDYVRIRTAAVKPGTELYDEWEKGDFEICSDDDKIMEIRTIIELSHDSSETYIVSDHMVNLLQGIEGKLSDRDVLLAGIDSYLKRPEDERRVFQLLRRTLRAYSPEDIDNIDGEKLLMLKREVMDRDEREWDIKMNGYICNYI